MGSRDLQDVWRLNSKSIDFQSNERLFDPLDSFNTLHVIPGPRSGPGMTCRVSTLWSSIEQADTSGIV